MLLHTNYNLHYLKLSNYIAIALTLFSLPVFSQKSYQRVYTPQNVPLNYTLPKSALAPDAPLTIAFSEDPADEEIYATHFFEEPLVAAEGQKSAEENKFLVLALAAFSQRKSEDDFRAITNFLVQY